MKKKYLVALVLLVIIVLASAAIVVQSLIKDGSPVPRILVKHQTLTGIVTEKFTDCVGGQEMLPSGEIIEITQISCDGGSYLTVDYEHGFGTASGLVPSSQAYAVDVSGIQVGDKVKVTYKETKDDSETFDCDTCGIEKIE